MLAGTIVATNYLAMAHVLARSYLAAHPDRRFVILVVDDGDASVDDDRIEVWGLDALDLDPVELAVMRTMYQVREFSTAVKPALLEAMLDRDDVAVYIDPDIYVYAPFDDLVVEPARDHDIVLTPHVLHPVPRDGLDPSERTLRLSGLFNLGFLAVSRGARPFLRWWAERLVTDAVVDLPEGLFTDQRWIDWVPTLFEHTVCRDPGMNIAWWNAYERNVELVDVDGRTVPTIDGGPVRFVHFSGYDPMHPEVFSHWQPRPRQSWEPGEPLRVLAERYGEELIASGHFERRRTSYQYQAAQDGTVLTDGLRALWRRSVLDELAAGRELGELRSPLAFGPGAERFVAWLDGVGGGTVDHPHARRERAVWERRLDLQRAFPDVDGADAEHFRGWLDRDPTARIELGDFRPAWYAPPTPADDEPPSVWTRAAGRVRREARHVVDRARHALHRRPAPPVPSRRVAFLHVPKCAGNSLGVALRESMPNHGWAPWTFDPDQFGPYADRELSQKAQELTLTDPHDLRRFDAAIGHFSLTSLLAGFDHAEIFTILRDPRCRLLSHHQFWRNLSDDEIDEYDTWADINALAFEQEFGEWLADPRVAYQTDNLFARMLVPHHPAIPVDDFIDRADVPVVLDAALAELRRLGWVDVIERGDATWADLGRRLGVPLRQERENVTVDHRRGRANSIDQVIGVTATARLGDRTVIDRALWLAAAEWRGVADPIGLADVEWSRRVAAALDIDER